MGRAHSYVLCLKNRGYPSALEIRKIYEALPDAEAEDRGLMRVIDESGEDYLYPANFFVAIDVPKQALRVFTRKTT